VKALAVSVAVILAGCGGGSDRSDVAQPVEQHLRGLAEGDFGSACAALTPGAQGDVIGLVAQVDGRRRSCPAAYQALLMIGSLDHARAGVMDLARAQHYGDSAAEVEVLDVHGAHAEARVSGSKKVIRLERGGDGWKIAGLDFTDVAP
jgi:hypothetical protein